MVEYVQGDPFAAPSRIRVHVSQHIAQYPSWSYSTKSRRVALETYLALLFAQVSRQQSERSGSGKSGLIAVDVPGQEILERTAINVDTEKVEARFVVGLPAQGRRVLGRAAIDLLCHRLPQIVKSALFYTNYTTNERKLIQRFVETNEDADALRRQLVAHGLVAFVANDSCLPRRSGVDERPLEQNQSIPFQSPASLQLTLDLPNHGSVTGMGLPQGVTLVVGGGFHGKSTLLNALERGIYNHRPDDGREFVVTDRHAVKIRAEDGRSIAGVDISPFIDNLPGGQSTRSFEALNASGSTSQATNIMEALELGARLLLIDEDTAATNFMIRDQRMQALIAPEKEPITPFIDQVRSLYAEHGVSTILVMGGSGDYFDVADTVIALDNYRPQDVTAEAKQIAARFGINRAHQDKRQFGAVTPRVPLRRSIDPRKGRHEISIKVRGRQVIQLGEETIDLAAISQVVDESQTRAIAAALGYAWQRYMDNRRSLREIIEAVMDDVATNGLDVLDRRLVGDLASFRKFELGAALNRLQGLAVRKGVSI